MQKITVYIYKAGMFSLIDLVHNPSIYSLQSALNTLSLEELTLIEWRGRITPHNLLTWQLRDNRKQYGVKLPVTVAVALLNVLQNMALSPDQQEVLNELYRSLVNNGFSPKYLPVTYHD